MGGLMQPHAPNYWNPGDLSERAERVRLCNLTDEQATEERYQLGELTPTDDAGELPRGASLRMAAIATQQAEDETALAMKAAREGRIDDALSHARAAAGFDDARHMFLRRAARDYPTGRPAIRGGGARGWTP